MSWIHYIDNEVPWDAPAHYGEWDSIVEAGGSTLTREAVASFPDRGSYGLRCQTVSGNMAYVQKDDVASIAPGGELYVGFWMKVVALPTGGNTYIVGLYEGSNLRVLTQLDADGDLRVVGRSDGGFVFLTWTAPPAVSGRWLYLVMGVKRASSDVAADGWFRMCFDGRLADEATNQDNYDSVGNLLDLRAGCQANARDNLDICFDEFKVATSYPEPYVPTPADEYPCPERTAVLYRTASADSIAFADYCVSELGIPLCNLIPLPDASADEALADYATFQAEVEDGIDAYLALNPTVAANLSCFLIGYGVPGYFTDGGVVHSAASRLMNYGTAFSSQTTNPLYAPSTVARLTKTALGGKYLCTRIDADTLQHAKDLIDRAATVAALAELPDADTLYSTDATASYRASLACQHLRILTDRLEGGEGLDADDAAFIWYAGGGWGTGGSRVAVGAPGAATGYLLRSGGATCRVALNTSTFAAALGNSHTADTLDLESFFEMLRIGGTLAEACIVAVAHLDYTAVGAGSPLLTVEFQEEGYNVYRGVGGIENVDFDTPVAHLRSDNLTPTLTGLGHAVSTRYTYAVRPVRGPNELETPDISCRCEMTTDGAGDWIGDRPAGIEFLEAQVKDGGDVEIRWGYRVPYGAAAPDDFGIYYGSSPAITPGSPQATETYAGEKIYTKTLTLTGGQTYWFAVTARISGGAESQLSRVLGPVVADDTAPATPTVYAGSAW